MTRIFIVSPEVFTCEELNAYELQILDRPHATEKEASRFFAEFPKFLAIGGYKKIAREVVLYRPDGEVVYRVDFCRCRFGSEYWDFVELKAPAAPLLVKQGAHWRLGNDLYKGIEQAQDYRDFLEETANRLELQRRSQIKAFRPQVLLLGGRSPKNFSPEDLIRVASRFSNVEIRTYDDILTWYFRNYSNPARRSRAAYFGSPRTLS